MDDLRAPLKLDKDKWIRFGDCPVCGVTLMASTAMEIPLTPFHNKSGGPGVCIGTSNCLKNVRFEDTSRFSKKNE